MTCQSCGVMMEVSGIGSRWEREDQPVTYEQKFQCPKCGALGWKTWLSLASVRSRL